MANPYNDQRGPAVSRVRKLLQALHSEFCWYCLPRLTERNATFKWLKESQLAFEELKSRLISAPVLAYPDFSKIFLLDTDASDMGIGAQGRIQGVLGVLKHPPPTLTQHTGFHRHWPKQLALAPRF
jgi:hypothetical protein